MISFFMAAFMLLVLFKYLKQHVVQQLQDGEEPVVVKTEEHKTQLALVVLN
jgi:hypothetical protein